MRTSCSRPYEKNQLKVENINGKYPIYGNGGIMGRADDYVCPENCTIIGRKR